MVFNCSVVESDEAAAGESSECSSQKESDKIKEEEEDLCLRYTDEELATYKQKVRRYLLLVGNDYLEAALEAAPI